MTELSLGRATRAVLVAGLLTLAARHTPAQSDSSRPQPSVPPSASPSIAPSTSQTAPPQGDEDRFHGLRAVADQLKDQYSKTDTSNMTEVDRLLHTRKCQINRVGGLLDRTIDALHEWVTAEGAYWTRWNEVEQQRVEDEQKKVAGMEADRDRVKDLIETESKDHEELLRKKADLERYGKRTQKIVEDIDALVQLIKDSEDRLQEAQRQFEDVSSKVNSMNASITARLIGLRENLRTVESYGLDMKSQYEEKRTEAQAVCDTKHPDARRSLPASRRPAAPQATAQPAPQ